jgi:hypothetical protein
VGERDIARSGFCGKTAAISGDILLLLAVLVSSHGDSCGSARIPKNVLGDRETLGRVKASGNVLSSLSQRFVGVLNSGEDPCQYRRASCHERPQEADARSETNARIRIQNVFFKPVGRSDRRVIFLPLAEGIHPQGFASWNHVDCENPADRSLSDFRDSTENREFVVDRTIEPE